MDVISQGAEAVLHSDGKRVVKERVAKKYRHTSIDTQIRAFRTRRETKVLSVLEKAGFFSPRILESDDTTMKITMEFLPGKRLYDHFDNDFRAHAQEIGRMIGQLHDLGVIHADLTTSNMILREAESNSKITEHEQNTEHEHDKEWRQLAFIDFGLSFFSTKVEDRAIDLHLLDRCLESSHYRTYPESFELVLSGYREAFPDSENVIKRLAVVKKRGRNKGS